MRSTAYLGIACLLLAACGSGDDGGGNGGGGAGGVAGGGGAAGRGGSSGGAAGATAASPIAVVDQNTGFDPTSGADTSDGVHANASGAMKIAARWFATLAPSIP